MSKRARDEGASADDPASTHAGVPAGRQGGRISIDVGGTLFISSMTTLTGSSCYFRSLIDRWDRADAAAEAIFIDADADAFQVLLSCMRAATTILPEHDASLFARAVLLAEYLGMDSLLAEIKARAYMNMHPGSAKKKKHRDNEQNATLFDKETGGLQAALASKILPARFFQPVPETPPPPPPPPERTIKASFFAPLGYKAFFSTNVIVPSFLTNRDYNVGEFMDIISFVVVELRDGTHTMDAFVMPKNNYLEQREAHEQTRSHIQLASAYAGETKHWLVVPPSTTSPLVPIPPGTVRGTWKKPAFTSDDEGKTLTIEGRFKDVKVDGASRGQIEWADDVPTVTDVVIKVVNLWGKEPQLGFAGEGAVQVAGGTVLLADGQSFKLPAASGAGNSQQIDLAFASFADLPADGVDEASSSLRSTFYMPIGHQNPTTEEGVHHQLVDARTVTFGDKVFSHFVGALRT